MDIKQVYQIANTAVSEAIGDSVLISEDWSNIVDVGNAVFDANAVDAYTKKLINHIGKVELTDKAFPNQFLDIYMDAAEYGSVTERIRIAVPEAQENESWNLVNGSTYDQQQFYQPDASATYFNKMTTYEIPMSITERQLKQSFSSAAQMNSFLTGIQLAIRNGLTLRNDELARRTIVNAMAQTIDDELTAAQYGNSGIRAVNLLKLYNDDLGQNLSADDALYDAAFIRYASRTIKLYADRLRSPSTLFNLNSETRITPSDYLRIYYHSEFTASAGSYLYDGVGQLKDENIKLPAGKSLPYWQGTGTDYAFSSTSKIYGATASGDSVTIDGIIGVMFDKYALGMTNENERTTVAYNAKGEFTNQFSKVDCRYYNDFSENFVVFFVHDPVTP